ncbi:MAG: TolC family protein [Gemmatimonadales bacterium]|nr:TolC family protein [Gemmatimonadales bacterium]
MIGLLLAMAIQDPGRLTLAQTVQRALAQYPTVAAARAVRDRAAADLGEATAGRRPRLSLDASLTRFQEPMVVFPLHGFDPANPPLFDRTLIQSGVTLNWTLFDFGNRASRVRAARALGGAADAALGAALSQLVARASNAYLRVLTARGVLAAQDQRLAALTAESERARRLLAEGKAARVEILRVAAELARSRADRIATEAQLEVAEHDLAQLAQLRYDQVHADSLAPLALSDTTPAPDRAAIVARARDSSPELLEVRRRSEAAQAGLVAARATRFPELRLSSGYFDRGRGSGDFKAEWQAGVGLSYALYTGGSRSSQISRADADRRGAGEQLRLAELNVEQGVDRALAAVREAHARVAALQSAVEQSEEVARIERLSLEVGSGTQTDYLDAEANLLRARASLIEVRNAEISARIELARIAGELSPDWITTKVTHGP